MRTKSKPNTGKRGISTANAYRASHDASASVKSPCTDLEGLIDAFGADAICAMARQIENDIRDYGDSIMNREYNLQLQALPLPRIRKKNKSRAEQKTIREQLLAAREAAKNAAIAA